MLKMIKMTAAAVLKNLSLEIPAYMYNSFGMMTDSSRKIHIGITPRNKKGAETSTEYQSSLHVHS